MSNINISIFFWDYYEVLPYFFSGIGDGQKILNLAYIIAAIMMGMRVEKYLTDFPTSQKPIMGAKD